MEEADQLIATSSAGPDAVGIFLVVITIAVFLLPVFIFFPPVPPTQTDAILQTHNRVGLTPAESETKRRRKPEEKANGHASKAGRISSLWIYPVKSCQGIELSQSKVLPVGLEFDRLFTFAQLRSPFPMPAAGNGTAEQQQQPEKEPHWEFVTLRQFPLLATVNVDLFVPDVIKHKGQPVASDEAFVVLRFPWRELGLAGGLSWVGAKIARGWRAVPEKEIVLPVAFPSEAEIAARGYAYEEVAIWKETVTALNMAAELPPELRLYLGVSNDLALFRVDPARLREVYRCAPAQDDAGYQPVTGFQDAYPLHLLSMSSVQDLDEKVPKDEGLKDLDVRRFRANIILDGVEPYDEETWKAVRFTPERTSRRQASTFHVSCRTVRCKMPNVDPEGGQRHPTEPDRSLRKYRDVDEGAKHMGCLGMQLTPLFEGAAAADPEHLESWLEVGMSVDVVERGAHLYIKQ